jgi:hypothetical protein
MVKDHLSRKLAVILHADELRLTGERRGPDGQDCQVREEDQPRGSTHVSDHASTALVDGRSPRFSSQGSPSAKRPFKDS